MTNDELQVIDKARATFHGLSAAVSLHLSGDETLALEGLRDSLQRQNIALSRLLDQHGFVPGRDSDHGVR